MARRRAVFFPAQPRRWVFLKSSRTTAGYATSHPMPRKATFTEMTFFDVMRRPFNPPSDKPAADVAVTGQSST
jgi:hypothetical protein